MPGPTVRNTPRGLVSTRNRGRRIQPSAPRGRRITPVSPSKAPVATAPVHGAPTRARRAQRVNSALQRVQKAFRSTGGVTGPGISKGESKFYGALANKTGLSPRVLAAQGTQEGGADQDYNILNIGHTDSGDLGITADRRFATPKGGASLTAKFLKGKEGGASQGIRNIIPQAKGKSDSEQVRAIAGSGWATDPRYAQGISSILPSIKSKGKAKPAKKDLKTLKKAGVPVPTKSAPAPGSNKHPFKKAAAKTGDVSKNVMKSPHWAPGTEINRAINPVVKSWAKKYGVQLNAAYDPGGGHVSPGHNETGTATDVQPAGGWTPAATHRFEQGLKVLTNAGFDVLYGTDGIGHPYPNHGRGNHAHIEWATVGSMSAGSSDALRKFGGLTEAQVKKAENTVGSSGGSAGGFSSSQISSYASATGMSVASAQKVAKKNPEIVKNKLARIRRAYADTSSGSHSGLTRSSRAKGAPVV